MSATAPPIASIVPAIPSPYASDTSSTLCAKCGSVSTVIDSRAVRNKHGQFRRRRRECVGCHDRHTTYEIDSATFAFLTRAYDAMTTAAAAFNEALQPIQDNPPTLVPPRRTPLLPPDFADESATLPPPQESPPPAAAPPAAGALEVWA